MLSKIGLTVLCTTNIGEMGVATFVSKLVDTIQIMSLQLETFATCSDVVDSGMQ